ncbi:MAG: hypothetical protein AB7R55_17415 [Gemmatimonadales bacterium]
MFRFDDGRYVVTDAQAHEALVFDSTGSLLEVLAGSGRGPGELGFPGPPRRFRGDSVAVVDMQLRRIVLFDKDGEHRATRGFPLQSPTGILAPIAVLSAEAFVGLLLEMQRPDDVGDHVVRKEHVVLGRFRNPAIDTIASTRGTELVGGWWRDGGERVVASYELPFGRSTKVSVGRDRIVVGSTDRAELAVLALDGEEIGVFRWSMPRDAVTEDDRERFLEREVSTIAGPAASSDRASLIRSDLMDLGSAKTHQAFTDLLVADDGSIWVETDQRPWLSERWFVVLDAAGTPTARIRIPRSFRIFQATGTSLVGVWREAGEADEVREYPVIK